MVGEDRVGFWLRRIFEFRDGWDIELVIFGI